MAAPLTEIERMSPEELRAELLRSIANENRATERWHRAEREKRNAASCWQSARIHVRSAQAIRHLQRHMPEALGGNVHPNIEIALMKAVEDLDKADAVSDEIPF